MLGYLDCMTMTHSLKKYDYNLDPGSRKFRCPACGKKRFVRYIDNRAGEYLPLKYGRCDREQNCKYHHSPFDDQYASRHSNKSDWRNFQVKPKPKKKPQFIPSEMLKKSMSNYENNSFIKYLHSLFDPETVRELIVKYRIGTSSKVTGGCIFYQVDITGLVRRGKIMSYGKDGHKLKNGFSSVHAQLGWNDQLPPWRFFGEHLLKDCGKTVAIVESEKTAMIASVYLPELVWLATGTKSTLRAKYAHALEARRVILYPDLGCYEEWNRNNLVNICNVSTSTFLEDYADNHDLKDGSDIADYLVKTNPTQKTEAKTSNLKDFNRRYESYNDQLAADGIYPPEPF